MTPVPELLRRYAFPLLGLSVIAAIATAIIVPRMPRGVDVILTFTIPIPTRPPSGEYEFDGFYALQATDLFAGTLAGWLASPDFVASVYERAGIAPPATTARRLARVFTARKLSGQLVELRFHAGTAEDGRRLSEEIVRTVAARTERFNEEGRGSLRFTVTPGEPLVLPVQRSAPLRALVAAIVTLVAAANAILFWDALKQPSSV